MEKFCPVEFEKLATKWGSAYRFLVFITAVIIMGLWAGCARPQASPTRPLLWTPTPRPTPVTVELSGKIDSAGILLEDVEVISSDGVAVLRLEKGTKVLDASSRPLDSITVAISRPQAGLDSFAFLSGLAYDFSPGGARLDPPAQLSISYIHPPITAYADKDRPQMAYFDTAKSTWTRLDVTVDLDARRVTARIDHLRTFAVVFEIWYSPPTS